MSDNPLDKLPEHNRVSIPAVLVHDGEDASAALAEAGFVNAIAIPVMLGDDLDLSGGILGNGITPNLTAVLETGPEDGFGGSPDTQSVSRRQTGREVRPSRPVTTMLPAAFGMQPLAPVRGIGQAGQSGDTGDERSTDRTWIDSHPPDRGLSNIVLANSVPPSPPSLDPFDLSQQDIERRYYNEFFWGMPVTQNQHKAMRQATAGLAAAGGMAGIIIGSMTEGAEAGLAGGPVGAIVGGAIGAVVGVSLGLIAGGVIGTHEDKAQGIPPLSPSARTR